MTTATRETRPHQRLAVLGSPIAHSLSPALHAAAYGVLSLPWHYEPIEVSSDALAGFIASRDTDWRGLSLTMPLKHTVLPIADSLDAPARLTQAANTVLFDRQPAGSGETVLRGFNTDVAGIVRALGAAGVTHARTVHVLGGGATAASTLAASAELGAERVVVAARNLTRAAVLEPLARNLGLVIELHAMAKARIPDSAELVVSTLPGGAEAPVGLPQRLSRAAMLLDVAYDPWPSALARSWESAGGRVLSGLAMLTHQALLQVRIFVGGDPLEPLPEEQAVLAAMRSVVGLDATGGPSATAETGRRTVPES